MLAKLQQLHTEVVESLDRLEALTGEQPPSREALATARWSLTRASVRRRRFLEEEAYPILVSVLPVAAMQEFHDLRAVELDMRSSSNAHVIKWTLERISADWAGYCEASRSLRSMMRGHVEAEKAALYPLLANLSERSSSANAAGA